MFDSRVLETAIGLVFLFLSLSLIATTVQEYIATVTRLRSATLFAGLRAMLVSGEQGLEFYRRLVNHPVVDSGISRPSYISAQQFSTAVLSLLGGSGQTPAAMMSLRIAAHSLPASPLKTSVISMFREGENGLVAFENRLQTWFNQSMDRVSGTYKRLAQYLSLAIGVAIAFVFQVNAIAFVLLLWTEPAMRTGVAAAGQAVKAGAGGTEVDYSVLAGLFRPIWEKGAFAITPTWFFGCAITAIAIGQGAPFWFDMLQKLMSVRGTGPPPTSDVVGIAKSN